MGQLSIRMPVQNREVVSYEDDVFAWVYLDHEDNLLRYEAYVLGYSQSGRPTTLELVLEEGVLNWDGPGAVTRLLSYEHLSPHEVKILHACFAEQEALLKRRNRGRWTKRLRALGYDVIPSL